MKGSYGLELWAFDCLLEIRPTYVENNAELYHLVHNSLLCKWGFW
jgi:hypothetical protein